jgi:AraC family transcriptional regulator
MQRSESTQIYWRRVNRVIDHFKDHLTEPLPFARLARLAHFSPFHFHRLCRSIVGEPLDALIRRLRAGSGHLPDVARPQSHADGDRAAYRVRLLLRFSRAFKQTYGFSPRGFCRDRLLQESKIGQDLMANAWYGFGKLPDPRNPDRFRVRLVDRPTQRIAYVRVIGSFDMQRLVAGFDRLMSWGQRRGLVPGAQLIGRPLDDLDITPMSKFRVDWCLVLPPGHDADGDVSFGVIPPIASPWSTAPATSKRRPGPGSTCSTPGCRGAAMSQRAIPRWRCTGERPRSSAGKRSTTTAACPSALCGFARAGRSNFHTKDDQCNGSSVS